MIVKRSIVDSSFLISSPDTAQSFHLLQMKIIVTLLANSISGAFKFRRDRNGQCQLSTAGQTMTETEKSSNLVNYHQRRCVSDSCRETVHAHFHSL